MDYFTKNPPSARIRALSLLGIVLAVGFTKLVDYDIWWHLITGELIWKWRQILPYDIFSYTSPGTPWVNPEWLYEVIAWLLLDNFGIVSFTILKLVLAACIAWAVYGTFKILLGSKSVALWGTVIMIFGIGDRIMDRPFLFSILITAWFVLELYRFAAGQKKNLWGAPNNRPSASLPTNSQSSRTPAVRSGCSFAGRLASGRFLKAPRKEVFRGSLWLLPLVQIAWINLHGAGIMGPVFVLAFALGESLQAFLKAASPIDAARRRHLWIAGLACLAACMLNPYGIDVYLLSFSLPDMKYIMMFTQEWIPALDSRLDIITSQIIFRTLAVAVLASYIINRKNARFSHLFLTAVTVALVLNGRRFTTDFILINLPILFYNVKNFVRYFVIIPESGYFHEWVNVLLVSLVSIAALNFGVPVTIKGGTTGDFGTGTSKMFAPSRMVDFLDENDIHGRVFSEMGVGGYLMFRRWPRDLVFLDGRTPIYGDDFYRRFIEAFKNSENFDELNRRWNFDYLVLTTAQVWEIKDFHKALWDSGKWKLVFADAAEGFVYVRDSPGFKKVIDKHALKRHPIVELMECAERADRPYAGDI